MVENKSIVVSSQILHRALALPGDCFFNESELLTNLLYFTVFMEKYLLHEKITVRDFYYKDYYTAAQKKGKKISEINFKARIKNSSIFSQLIKENSIDIIKGFKGIDKKIFDRYQKELGYGKWSIGYADCYYEIKYALSRNKSFIPDVSPKMKNALIDLKYRNEENTIRLINIYSKMSKSLKTEVEKLVKIQKKKKIFIPPITAKILSSSIKIKEIPKIALDMKHKFSSLRDAINEYEERVQDDSLSLKESLESYEEFENTVSQLYKTSDESLPYQVTEWRDLSNIMKLIDGASASDISSLTSMFLGKPLKFVSDKLKKRRISYLFDLKNSFMNIKKYGMLYQNTFNVEFQKAHFEDAIKNGFDDIILRNF